MKNSFAHFFSELPVRLLGGFLLLAVLPGMATLRAQSPLENRDPAQLGSGDPAWLAYRAIDSVAVFGRAGNIPGTILVLGQDAMEQSAASELVLGWRGMLNHVPHVVERPDFGAAIPTEGVVVVGTQAEVRAWRPGLSTHALLGNDAYRLHRVGNLLLIEGGDVRGALYGTFTRLREIAQKHSLRAVDETSQPWAAVRWTNEWDNPNGSIERGYGGPSIFFENDHVRADLSRAAAYARLLASVGIDGCTVDNVNTDPHLLLADNLTQIARIADAFRPYGVRLSMAVDMNSPQSIGGLPTFDPLDPRVAAKRWC